MDSGSPAQLNLSSVFRSNVASSLVIPRPSNDNAIMVWPLWPVVSNKSRANLKLKFLMIDVYYWAKI